MCPPVQLNNKQLTQPEEVKYLDIHLDLKLTWRKHISTKRKQLDLKLCKLYWIIGRKCQLSLENKTTSIQSNPETYLDLWCTTVWIRIKL
jgi:hypothetical protein